MKKLERVAPWLWLGMWIVLGAAMVGVVVVMVERVARMGFDYVDQRECRRNGGIVLLLDEGDWKCRRYSEVDL